jgi:excisionase family DNA binding protein
VCGLIVGTRNPEQRARDHAVSQEWTSHVEGPSMSAALEPLALSPREAADFLSIGKRSPSRLIRPGKIEARKAGPRTRVGVASLKAYCEVAAENTDHPPIVFGRRAHAVLRSRSEARH